MLNYALAFNLSLHQLHRLCITRCKYRFYRYCPEFWWFNGDSLSAYSAFNLNNSLGGRFSSVDFRETVGSFFFFMLVLFAIRQSVSDLLALWPHASRLDINIAWMWMIMIWCCFFSPLAVTVNNPIRLVHILPARIQPLFAISVAVVSVSHRTWIDIPVVVVYDLQTLNQALVYLSPRRLNQRQSHL